MIIENGKLSALVKTGGGVNGDGNPVAPSLHWADSIPCNIQANKYSNNGAINGNTFIASSYHILIDTNKTFSSEQVRLETNEGKILGEFSVLQIESMPFVNCIKIVV